MGYVPARQYGGLKGEIHPDGSLSFDIPADIESCWLMQHQWLTDLKSGLSYMLDKGGLRLAVAVTHPRQRWGVVRNLVVHITAQGLVMIGVVGSRKHANRLRSLYGEPPARDHNWVTYVD